MICSIHVKSVFRRKISSFKADDNGNVALLFGLAIVPIFILLGMTVDTGRAINVKTAFQAASDAASLAGAKIRKVPKESTSDGTDESGTMDADANAKVVRQLATDYVMHNLPAKISGQLATQPDVKVTFVKNNVKVSVTGKMKTTFGSLLQDNIAVGARSLAVGTPVTKPMCLLSLNKTAPDAMSVSGTADLTAKGCAVQVNSSSVSGISQSGSSTITSEDICVNGGYSGTNYSPKLPSTGCPQVADPLLDQFTKDLASSDLTSCNRYYSHSAVTFAKGTTTLLPGVYCGGASIGNNVNIVLQPGVYVFKDGAVKMHGGGSLSGKGVTIILTGTDTNLVVQAGGNLNLQAKSSGTFAGIAVGQDPASTTPSNRENLIIGGGNIEVVGLMYFPTQSFRITGNGKISTESKQFAIIADTISIEGNGLLEIGTGADFAAAGLPELPGTITETIVRLAE